MPVDEGLTTDQLHSTLESLFNPKGIPFFVIAADEMHLVNFNSLPCCIIQNTKNHDHLGEHWIAYWIPNNRSFEYFDSFGSNLTSYEVKRPPGRMTASNQCALQSENTSVCGHFCIYFLYFRSISSFDCIIKRFSSSNKTSNDKKVLRFYKLATRFLLTKGSCNLRCSKCIQGCKARLTT